MRLDHLLSMENMSDYHESLVFKIAYRKNERRSADTERSMMLVVVQFSVTERVSLKHLTYWRIAQVVRARA